MGKHDRWHNYPDEMPPKTGFYMVKVTVGGAEYEESLFFLSIKEYKGFEVCFDTSETITAWRGLTPRELKEATCQ